MRTLRRVAATAALSALALSPLAVGSAAQAASPDNGAARAAAVRPAGWTPYASYVNYSDCTAALAHYPQGWAFCAWSNETYSWLLWVYVS